MGLGLYQTSVVWMKKVGGPERFIALVMAGGYLVGRTVEAGVKAVVKAAKKPKNTPLQIYTVHTPSTSNDLHFVNGDTFHILEVIKDGALIEKIGDPNNPYFVSVELLRTISDYK